MAKAEAHKWQFKARFRRHAFGWKSQPAIQRVKEAVSEIKKVARKDKILAAEGAIIFLEKLSPALESVDSSSGAIGTAVNNALAALVPILAEAPADAKTRDTWLERLYDAYEKDEIPYIELLGDYWGDLCVSREVASRWADQLIGTSKMAWSADPSLRGFFKGTTNCLSALLVAERYKDILELLETERHKVWHYRQYGVKALAAMGKKSEAIRYAEESRGLNENPIAIARACEEVLLSSGLVDEAYRAMRARGIVAKVKAKFSPPSKTVDDVALVVALDPALPDSEILKLLRTSGLIDDAVAIDALSKMAHGAERFIDGKME